MKESNGGAGRQTAADRRHGVLLAIGNSSVRWSLKEHLAERGFETYATGDANVALAWLERHKPDIVITDVLLPGTRIALPHLLRRRGRETCPRLVGLADDGEVCDEIRDALRYDVVVRRSTPAAVLTKSILLLLAAGRPSAPTAARAQRRAEPRLSVG